MAEYVERDKAISMGFSDGIEEDGIIYVPWRDVAKHLKSLPAADVRENVRGEWIFEKGDGVTCADAWYCSICKHGFHTNVPYFSEYNFCPNCGADMRGEKT